MPTAELPPRMLHAGPHQRWGPVTSRRHLRDGQRAETGLSCPVVICGTDSARGNGQLMPLSAVAFICGGRAGSGAIVVCACAAGAGVAVRRTDAAVVVAATGGGACWAFRPRRARPCGVQAAAPGRCGGTETAACTTLQANKQGRAKARASALPLTPIVHGEEVMACCKHAREHRGRAAGEWRQRVAPARGDSKQATALSETSQLA